jgi:hypothetical protein
MFLLRRRPSRPSSTRRARLWLEALESRLVPYSLSGDAWVHPELITISFVPDGTILGSNSSGYIYSNLQSTFNSHPYWTQATWQNQILRAAQVWAQQTNVNFAVVADNGAPIGSGSYQQGDPGFGDIRIGGYNFGSSNYLAVAEMPPQDNNYSVAGDITFNTGQPFNIGSTYDLFTVAMHEMGHALGLYESNVVSAAMYPTYSSAKPGLGSDDISGIRAIYGSGRSPDAYDAAGSNGSFAAASNLNSLINPSSLTALATGLDISTTADLDYYTFTAPSGTSGTLTVTVQSGGLSLLAPNLTVYAANQSTVLGSASGAGKYGTTLTVTVGGVTAGQQFYVKVAGADSSAFGTGKYALTLNFGSGPSPTVPLPNTQTANGSTYQSSGGQAQSTATSTSVLGGVTNTLGGVVNTAGKVTRLLVGTLLGISTKVGIGAGIGDPASPTGEEDDEGADPTTRADSGPAAGGLEHPPLAPTSAGAPGIGAALAAVLTGPAPVGLRIMPMAANAAGGFIAPGAALPAGTDHRPRPVESVHPLERVTGTGLETKAVRFEVPEPPGLAPRGNDAGAPLPWREALVGEWTIPDKLLDTDQWREACAACFTDPALAPAAETGAATSPGSLEGTEAAEEPGAVAALLAAVAGTWAAAPRAGSDEERRERASVSLLV